MVWGQSLPPFSGLQNEGVSCQFIPALVFYHCLSPSSGLFPRIHSKVSVTGPGVLNPGTTGLWGQMTLSSGCCPVRCRMFSSMPGSNPLDANHATPSRDNQKNVSTHARCSLRGKIVPCGEPRHQTTRPRSQSRRPPFIKMPVSIKQGPGRNIGSFLFKLFSLKTQQRRTVYSIH